jgi:ribonuclease HII
MANPKARRPAEKKPRPAPDDLTIGLDEAGRGPILGPMVMACVAIRERSCRALVRAGVTDSKLFGSGAAAHATRSELVPQILDLAEHVVIDVIDVAEIDRRASRGELNRLEQERARFMLERSPPAQRIVADGERLFAPLRQTYPLLEAVNHGESCHVAVAAASILAKVRRDQIWDKICRRYEPHFGALSGGGYVNEPTRRFLRAYCQRHRSIPPEGRQSWPWTFVSDLLDRTDSTDLRPQMSLF